MLAKSPLRKPSGQSSEECRSGFVFPQQMETRQTNASQQASRQTKQYTGPKVTLRKLIISRAFLRLERIIEKWTPNNSGKLHFVFLLIRLEFRTPKAPVAPPASSLVCLGTSQIGQSHSVWLPVCPEATRYLAALLANPSIV